MLWLGDVRLGTIFSLRGRPDLERALIDAMIAGPSGVAREVVRHLAGGRTKVDAVLHEILRANLVWMEDDICHGEFAAASEHLARACAPILVQSRHHVLIAASFKALVSAGEAQQSILAAATLRDSTFLLRPAEANSLARHSFDRQDPADWLRVALRALASQPLLAAVFQDSLRAALTSLSWPGLRGQWWVPRLRVDALPRDIGGLPPMAIYWLRIASAEPSAGEGAE